MFTGGVDVVRRRILRPLTGVLLIRRRGAPLWSFASFALSPGPSSGAVSVWSVSPRTINKLLTARIPNHGHHHHRRSALPRACRLVPPGRTFRSVTPPRWTGQSCTLVIQVTPAVGRQAVGRPRTGDCVPSPAPYHDPVELAPHQTAQLPRLVLRGPDDARHSRSVESPVSAAALLSRDERSKFQGSPPLTRAIRRSRAGQELVQHTPRL